MDSRPRLRPGQRPLRRGSDSLQFGLAAGRALVLSGLRGDEVRLVESLDGRHTVAQLYAVAARLGVERTRVDALLWLLRAEGLLAPAGPDQMPLWRAAGAAPRKGIPTTLPSEPTTLGRVRRAHRHVVVGGWGSAPDAIAATLRAAGVGRVETGSWAVDHAELDLRHRSRGLPVPDLVVLAAQEALDPGSGVPWRRHGVALLAFVADAGRVTIGPLVTPDPGPPCLHCLELHRTDRDEHWPDLLAQVCTDPSATGPVRSEVTLTAAAAGVAAMVAVGYLDGRPIPPGLTLELSLPFPRLDHRIWPRHPQCADHPALRNSSAG